jgi:hypothetical protein
MVTLFPAGVKVRPEGVGRGGFEADYRFPRFGVSEPFTRESFDRFWVTSQRFNGVLELAPECFFFLDLGVHLQDFLPQPLVMFNQGEVPNRNTQHPGHKEQKYHHSCQVIPDAETHSHCVINKPGCGSRESKNALIHKQKQTNQRNPVQT